MVDGECEPRESGNDDATFPWCAISVRANDARDQRIADLVLYPDIIHHGSVPLVSTVSQARKIGTLRSDEELVLNVNKMFGHLNGCMVLRILLMHAAEEGKPLR